MRNAPIFITLSALAFLTWYLMDMFALMFEPDLIKGFFLGLLLLGTFAWLIYIEDRK